MQDEDNGMCCLNLPLLRHSGREEGCNQMKETARSFAIAQPRTEHDTIRFGGDSILSFALTAQIIGAERTLRAGVHR